MSNKSPRPKLNDLLTESLLHHMAAMKTAAWAELYDAVYADLKFRNAISGGVEMFRLRSYEKLQKLVNDGKIARDGKLYTAVTCKTPNIVQPDDLPPDLLDVAVRVLDEAYAADPAAMHALMHVRIPCNVQLAGHPTIQVRDLWEGTFEVGFIGLLNGIVEAATGKRVAAIHSDDGEGHLLGFAPYNLEINHNANQKLHDNDSGR